MEHVTIKLEILNVSLHNSNETISIRTCIRK